MSLLKRLVRIVKADLHGAVDRLEDKPALLRQHLREMAAATAQKRQHLKALQHSRSALCARRQRMAVVVEGLDGTIDGAVEAQKMDTARTLIRKKSILGQRRAMLDERIKAMDAVIQGLEQRIDEEHLVYESLCSEVLARLGEADFAVPGDPSLSEFGEPASSYPIRINPGEHAVERELAKRLRVTAKEEHP